MYTIVLGLQSWTFRRFLRTNPDECLGRLKKCGITNLELAGTAGQRPDHFKELCDWHGFNIIGTHEPTINKENESYLGEEMIFRCKLFGCHHATIMWDPEVRRTPHSVEVFANKCEALGRRLATESITLNFHCYADDLRLTEAGSLSTLDILCKNTKSLAFELDTYFLFSSDCAVNSVISSVRGRCRLVHINDITSDLRQAPIGKGRISWPETLAHLTNLCAPEWFIIEHDTASPFEWLSDSLDFLRASISISNNASV